MRLLIALATAAVRLPAQAATPAWSMATKPVTTIGIVEGDATRELADVSSAHRLADGSVVIANGKPLELRVYTAAGAFMRRIGHAGEGPGEFRDGVQVFGWAGDSLLTYTSGNKRWALFTPTGSLVREWEQPGRTSPTDLLVYRRTFTIRRVNAPAACVRAVVDRIPATNDPIREVFADAAGRFWVRGPRAREWRVYTLAGKAIARVRLPADAELLEAGGGAAVVKARDADDVERVEVWRVSMPATTPRIADRCHDVADSSIHAAFGLVSAMMRTDLRNMQTGAEAYYRRLHRYPATVADFGVTFSKGADTDVRLLMSSDRGWGAMITDKATGMYCVDFVGVGLLPGWPSGAPSCALKEAAPPH